MKAVLCYNDNENEKLRTTIRITIPKNWKGIAVPKVHNLLQEFITPYNAHYKNKNILTLNNVYLAIQKDDIPTTGGTTGKESSGGFFRNRKSNNNTTNTTNNQLHNMDSFDSLDARYIPLDPDSPISSCIKNNITVYVLHKMKATLTVVPSPNSKSKSKSTTTITNTKNVSNRKHKTPNERILAAFTNETDTVDCDEQNNTTINDDTYTDAGESYQDMHSSYSSESLRDDSLDGSYIEPDNDNDDYDEARDDVEESGDVEKCSNLSIVKENDSELLPPMRQKLSIFSAIVTNRQNHRDCDGSVSSIPSRLGWMNRNNSIIKNDLHIARTRARPNKNHVKKHSSSDNRSVTSLNTDRSNLYVHNLFRKLRKQAVNANGDDNNTISNTTIGDGTVLLPSTTTATATVVEPYLQSHQVLTRTESMKKRVSFGKDTYAFETINEEETITSTRSRRKRNNTIELSSNDDDDDGNDDDATNKNNSNDKKVNSTSTMNKHNEDDEDNDDDDDDANEIFSCGDDYVNVTPVVPVVSDSVTSTAINKRSSNEENECHRNDSMDNNSIAKDLQYLTTLLDNLKPNNKKHNTKNNNNKGGGQLTKKSLVTHDEILLQSKKNIKNRSSNNNNNSNTSTHSRDIMVLPKPNNTTTTAATTTAAKTKTSSSSSSSVSLQQNSFRQSSIAGVSASISDGEDEYSHQQHQQKHSSTNTNNNKSSSDLIVLRNTLVRLDIMPDCDLFDTVTNDLLYHHQQNLKNIKKVSKNDLYNVVAREMKQRIETSILLMLAEYHSNALARENYNAKNNNSIRNGKKNYGRDGSSSSFNSIEEEEEDEDDDDDDDVDEPPSNEEDNAVMVNPHFYDRSVQKLRDSSLNNISSSSIHTYATKPNKARKNNSNNDTTTTTTTNSITTTTGNNSITNKRGTLNLLEMHNSTKQPPKIQQSIQFRDTEAIVVVPSSNQSVFQSLFCSAE